MDCLVLMLKSEEADHREQVQPSDSYIPDKLDVSINEEYAHLRGRLRKLQEDEYQLKSVLSQSFMKFNKSRSTRLGVCKVSYDEHIPIDATTEALSTYMHHASHPVYIIDSIRAANIGL